MSDKIVIVTDRDGRRKDVIGVPADPRYQQLRIGEAKEYAYAVFGTEIYTFVEEADGFSVCQQDVTIHSNPLAANNRFGRGWSGITRAR